MIPFLLLFLCNSARSEHPNLVKDLPGLIFEPNFKTYSGYLHGHHKETFQMHYMLFESRSNASEDPLIVWFNGGPGCSSMLGAFSELGPFFPLPQGNGLFENVFAWNQRANLMILESPVDVGFSFNSNPNKRHDHNDRVTAHMNALALNDFFKRVHPEFQNRDFFLTGESYAGVYIPALAVKLTKMINRKKFINPNFKGIAIGNGKFNHVMNQLSTIIYNVYRGFYPLEEWAKMRNRCGVTDEFLYKANADQIKCLTGKHIQSSTFVFKLLEETEMEYNVYQSCNAEDMESHFMNMSQNPADYFWKYSSDNKRSFPCWALKKIEDYLNKKRTRSALNIPSHLRKEFTLCNDDVTYPYQGTHDTTVMFKKLLNIFKGDFRILIYSGDLDGVCPYIGTEWFLRELAIKANLTTSRNFTPWYYADLLHLRRPQPPAGYTRRYENSDGSKTIDYLTVKNAGHMVPMDAPGPSLHMISNFIHTPSAQDIDYDSWQYYDDLPDPLPLRRAAKIIYV